MTYTTRRNDGFKDIKFQTGVSILNKGVDNAQVINIFRRILSIGPINVMAPLIATALLGPLFRLFSEGSDECRPSFVTFINERSGSLKTAVAKVLYTMFNADNPKVPASFKDTATSMELRLKEARCAVALIDDYYATGISSVKCEMQRSLETIIRFVGDGISRNRSNANLEDVRGARPEGMVAITGEDTDGQLSTLLRCLVVNVDRGTFDGARLDEFQQDKLLWSTFLAVFIEYLEIKYVQIQSFITMNFSMVRQIYKDKFSDLRPVDQMVQLHLVYDILKEFLIALGGDGEEMNNHCLHCISGCFEAVKFSHEYAIENSAENQYPIVVYNLISKSEVHIAKTKDIYAVDAKSFDGFETEDYYVFDAERLYAKVLAYYRRLERRFPLTPSACKAALYKAGLLKVAYEKRGTDKEKLLYEIKYAFGNTRIRLLTIVKKSLADFMEDKL